MILPGALGAALALLLLDGEAFLPLVGWSAASLLFFEAGLLRCLRVRRCLDPNLQGEADHILVRAEAQVTDPHRLILEGASLVVLALLLPLEHALLLATSAAVRVLLSRLP